MAIRYNDGRCEDRRNEMTTHDRDKVIAAANGYWRRDQWNNEYFDAAGFFRFVAEECAKVVQQGTLDGKWCGDIIREWSTK